MLMARKLLHLGKDVDSSELGQTKHGKEMGRCKWSRTES